MNLLSYILCYFMLAYRVKAIIIISYKILGVHVSDDRTWNTHIDHLLKN